MTATQKHSLLSWGYFFFLSITWGSSFILIKRGLEGFTIWQAASIRLLVAALVLGGFAIKYIRTIPKEKIKWVMLSGVFGTFAPSYLFCAAETHLDSSVTGVLNALTPAFACLVGYIFFKKSLRSFQVAGLVIGFLGTAFLILVGSGSGISINGYALLVVIASTCYGINLNLVKSHLSDVDPLKVAAVSVTFSGLYATVFLFFADSPLSISVDEDNLIPLLALCTLGVLGTAIANIVLNKLIKTTSVVFASSNTYVIPAVAVFWGILDGEHLLILHFIGMATIILGILILNGKINLLFKTKEIELQ